jgi:hypothetical protein
MGKDFGLLERRIVAASLLVLPGCFIAEPFLPEPPKFDYKTLQAKAVQYVQQHYVPRYFK